MTEQNDAMAIDVVSDVVCPWCYLGKKRLEKALAMEANGEIPVRWRPYQLDPTIPAGGMDRKTYMRNKFGDNGRLEEVHDRLRALGAEEGIAFAFDKIERSPNTLDAHRLIRWAAAAGTQDIVVDNLFSLYFEQGRDIGDRQLLTETARDAGMDSEAVEKLLVDGADENEVREEIAQAQSLGVTGVPFFIFASRFGVPGAQSADVLSTAIERARKSIAGIETA
jgi:predicted DsbA family dithiol-disulfide isomerase